METAADGSRKLLINWSGREDSNLRPLGPKSPVRQNAKLLPFRKLQPPRVYWGFAVLSHSLSARHGDVLQILSTNWPQIFGVNPRLKTGFIATLAVE